MLSVESTSQYTTSNSGGNNTNNSSSSSSDANGASSGAAGPYDTTYYNSVKEPTVHMDYYSAYSRGQQAWGGGHYPAAYQRDQHPHQQHLQHLQHHQHQLPCYPAGAQQAACTPQFPPASGIIELPAIDASLGHINNSSGGSICSAGGGGPDEPAAGIGPGVMEDGSCVKLPHHQQHQQQQQQQLHHHHLHHQQHLLRQGVGAAAPAVSGGGVAKLKKPKKKKKRDPHEPQKPVSAYAMFFRDTQSKIKAKKPDASFGEISKLVASMWDNLDQDDKNDYKKRTETAKKEYLRKLAAYKARMVSMETPLGYGNASTYIDLGYYQQPGFAQRHLYYQQQQQQQAQQQLQQQRQQGHMSQLPQQQQQQQQHPAAMTHPHPAYYHQQHQHLQHHQAMQHPHPHQAQMHQGMMYYPNPVASPTDMLAGDELNQQHQHYPVIGGHCSYSAQLQQHVQHQQHIQQHHQHQMHQQQQHGYAQQQQPQMDNSSYQQAQQAASIPSPAASADTPSGDSSSNCQATPQAASSPASAIMHHQQQQQHQVLTTPTAVGATWSQQLKKVDDAYATPGGGEEVGGAAQFRDMYAYWMGRQEAPVAAAAAAAAAQDSSFSEAVM